MKRKISIAISGIGNRALPKNKKKAFWSGWLTQINKSNKYNLVAVHDISNRQLKRVVNSKLLNSHQVYNNFDKLLKKEKLDAILICNPARFHYEYIRKSLKNNLHVLVEKPLVSSFKEAVALSKSKKKKNISVIQNWRTKDVGRIIRKFILSGKIGHVGQIFFRYIRNRENSSYPSYIYNEKFPALYAMGIHHLDLFRYILSDEIKKVNGSFFKPKWSLYSSSTGFNLHLVTKKNTFINYTSTFSSLSNITNQESLIINGSKGSLINESSWLEPPLFFQKKNSCNKQNLTSHIKKTSINDQYNISDKMILENFYEVVLKKRKAICSYQDAFQTIKLLEHCKNACISKREIRIRA